MRGQYIQGDCMEHLSGYGDNYFSLAIVDPPYGAFDKMKGGGKAQKKIDQLSKWDFAPNQQYFDELFRVSKNQIIWGANYFTNMIPVSNRWVCFQKFGLPKLPQFELAWTSLNIPNKIFSASRKDININWGKWIHPTQKPIKLYRWLLQNYAKPNDLILDTHVGSASSLIACEIEGFKYVGFEKDIDYYQQSTKRIKQHLAQKVLF